MIAAGLLAVAALAGCALQDYRPGDPVVVEVRGYTEEYARVSWRATVVAAGAAWRDSLGCADPFPVASGDVGGPVLRAIMFSPEEWPHDPRNNGFAPTGDEIHLLGPEPRVRTVLHEMGHVMHLVHSPDTESVMHAPVVAESPSATDVALAAGAVCP